MEKKESEKGFFKELFSGDKKDYIDSIK